MNVQILIRACALFPAVSVQHLGCLREGSGRRLPVGASNNSADISAYWAASGRAGVGTLDTCLTAALAGNYRLFGLQVRLLNHDNE